MVVQDSEIYSRIDDVWYLTESVAEPDFPDIETSRYSSIDSDGDLQISLEAEFRQARKQARKQNEVT